VPTTEDFHTHTKFQLSQVTCVPVNEHSLWASKKNSTVLSSELGRAELHQRKIK